MNTAVTTELKLADITPEIASANILAYAREGRLVQGQWHGRGGDGQGRDIACLLGSIHPDIDGVGKCPAGLMPKWMAYLTVRLFDGVPSRRVAEYGEAYATRLHKWGQFDDAAWERVRVAFITDVFGGAIKRAESKMTNPAPENWGPIKAVSEELLALLLSGTAKLSQYRGLRDRARELRQQAWAAYGAAVERRRQAEAAAEAAEAEAEAAEAEAEAEAAEAEAEAAVAAVEAEAEAAAAAAAAVAAVAAAVAAAAVAAAAAAAVAEVAVAVAVAAAEVAVEVAAEVAAEVARRDSYAASFDSLLRIIDVELAAA